MAVISLKKIWENEYFKTAVTIILIIAIFFGFWYGSQLVLNTRYPVLAVASGSMCTVKGVRCGGWFHPFSPTLHTGDLIVVQGVNPKEIKTSPYPYGDVIVFQQTKAWENSPDDLIVHRAIGSEVNPNNGMIYFETKGDANSEPDHHDDYRGENYSWNGMVSEKLVVGKVIFRIPWIGHIALFMRNSSGIFIILFLIIIVVIMFIIPAFKGKEAEAKQEENLENAFET